MTDPIFQLMREASIELTWENFVSVQYLGNPPQLDAEVEAELREAYDAAIWQEMGIEAPEEVE